MWKVLLYISCNICCCLAFCSYNFCAFLVDLIQILTFCLSPIKSSPALIFNTLKLFLPIFYILRFAICVENCKHVFVIFFVVSNNYIYIVKQLYRQCRTILGKEDNNINSDIFVPQSSYNNMRVAIQLFMVNCNFYIFINSMIKLLLKFLELHNFQTLLTLSSEHLSR